MIRAVLFDLGDTLIDFEPLDTRALFRRAAHSTYEYLSSLRFALPQFEDYCRTQFRAVRWSYLWAKLSRREFNSLQLLRRFCRHQRLALDEAMLLELAWRWYQPFTEHSSAEDDLFETLMGIRRMGLKLALISNTFIPGAVMDCHLDLHSLRELFPVRIYSSEVRYRKPDPRIFEMALKQIGVAPAEAIFVGDLVKTDIVGARRVGMTTILKQPWGMRPTHRVADHVVRQISDLSELIPKLMGERR